MLNGRGGGLCLTGGGGGLCLTGGGGAVLNERGGGFWDPKVCVPNMARPDCPYCEFRFPARWSLWAGGGSRGGGSSLRKKKNQAQALGGGGGLYGRCRAGDYGGYGMDCGLERAAPDGLSPLTLAFPSLRKRRRPSGPHPLAPSLPLPGLPSPPLHPLPLPSGGCTNGAPGQSLFHCPVSGPHGGGRWEEGVARSPRGMGCPHSDSNPL